MVEFYEKLQRSLKKDERFLSADGKILKNAVYEAAMKPDAELLQILLSDANFRKMFFVDVDGVKVFDKVKFAWVINNREFLPDSYTALKTKSGSSMKTVTSFPNPATLSWSSLTKIPCWKVDKLKTIKSAFKFFTMKRLRPMTLTGCFIRKFWSVLKNFRPKASKTNRDFL